LQPVPEGLQLKGQGTPHRILLQDEKGPSYSPTERARSDFWKEKGLGHDNASSAFFSPNASRAHSERKN